MTSYMFRMLLALSVAVQASGVEETCESCQAPVAPSMLQAGRTKAKLQPEKPVKHRYANHEALNAQPALNYFKSWSAKKIANHLSRQVPSRHGLSRNKVPTALNAKALRKVLTKHRGTCPVAEDFELHHSETENGIQHAVLVNSQGAMQYVAVEVNSGRVLAADPKKMSCPIGMFIQADDVNVTSNITDPLGGTGEGTTTDTPPADGGAAPLKKSDKLVKQCEKMLKDVAKEQCGKTYEVEFLASNLEVVAGFRVQALVAITGKNGTGDHAISCAFELPNTTSASLIQTSKLQRHQRHQGHQREGNSSNATKLLPHLEMAIDICDADTNSSAGAEALSAMQFMKKHGFGYLSRYKGEDVDQKRIVSLAQVVDVPDEFDQRTAFPACYADLVVRDQGSCGSCWSFAMASTTMSNLCASGNGSRTVNAGDRFEISTQSMMSCNSGGAGCEGGNFEDADSAFDQVGLVKESSFPYQCGGGDPHDHFDVSTAGCETAPWGATCDVTATPGWYYDGFINLNGEADIMSAMGHYGAALKMSFTVYQSVFDYTSGVLTAATGTEYGGHAVAGLGYGTENGQPYWLIQNSWGTSWGMNGFGKFKRGINLMGIEEGATVMTGYVAGGLRLPCMDSVDAGIASDGIELTCEEAVDFCNDYDIVKESCPATCSWTELQCYNRTTGGYLRPDAPLVTTTTPAPEPCKDAHGNVFNGGTLGCADVAGSCSYAVVYENCPATCGVSVDGCTLETTTTTTGTMGECVDGEHSGLSFSDGSSAPCSAVTPDYCTMWGGTVQMNCPASCNYENDCYLPNPPAPVVCSDNEDAGVSVGGPTLTCEEAQPYCWHGTVLANCPLTCRDETANCVLPEEPCTDSASTGLSSGGNDITCDSDLVGAWDLCNHGSYGSTVTANCPLTCGACS